MILIFNAFITNSRPRGNRYPRIDIFKYALYSYRNIPFSEIYMHILLDNEFLDRKDHIQEYIYATFSRLERQHIHLEFTRYTTQGQWIPLITNLYNRLGGNELVMLLNNDDHVFVDYDMNILSEGLELLSKEQNRFKSIYLSHWPELIKFSGKYMYPIKVGNYLKFGMTILDSVQIFNLAMVYHLFVEYKWKGHHARTDSIINELTSAPSKDNVLCQVIYVPFRELFRKFDGYDHVYMPHIYCPPLNLPTNVFDYSRDSLIRKITAPHNSVWAQNNTFVIPDEWINKYLSLHTVNTYELTMPN